MRIIRALAPAALAGLLLAPLGPAPQASAEEVKIAVVDARRALITSKRGRQAEEKLKSMMEEKKAQIEPLEKQLKRREEEFQAQKYVLSPAVAEERKLELIKEHRDLERTMQEAQEELEIEQRKLMQPMLKMVEDALGELGKEKNFAVILEKSSPGVLYISETLDITDLVIQKLNEKN